MIPGTTLGRLRELALAGDDLGPDLRAVRPGRPARIRFVWVASGASLPDDVPLSRFLALAQEGRARLLVEEVPDGRQLILL